MAPQLRDPWKGLGAIIRRLFCNPVVHRRVNYHVTIKKVCVMFSSRELVFTFCLLSFNLLEPGAANEPATRGVWDGRQRGHLQGAAGDQSGGCEGGTYQDRGYSHRYLA